MTDEMFRFSVGQKVKDKHNSNAEVVWLKEDGQYALKVDRTKHDLLPWVNKVVDWNGWEKA